MKQYLVWLSSLQPTGIKVEAHDATGAVEKAIDKVIDEYPRFFIEGTRTLAEEHYPEVMRTDEKVTKLHQKRPI